MVTKSTAQVFLALMRVSSATITTVADAKVIGGRMDTADWDRRTPDEKK